MGKSGSYTGGDVDKRDCWTFGAESWICGDLHFVANNLFPMLAKLLWVFDVR
jgi:hypothetical protein